MAAEAELASRRRARVILDGDGHAELRGQRRGQGLVAPAEGGRGNAGAGCHADRRERVEGLGQARDQLLERIEDRGGAASGVGGNFDLREQPAVDGDRACSDAGALDVDADD